MALYNQPYPQYPYPQQFYNQPPVQNPNVQMPTPQIQNSGVIINIPNENDARSYPVGPGNSLTFKDENAPYIYTKTMGFSQFDKPIFEKYRLVKEGDETPGENIKSDIINDLKDEIDFLKNEIEGLKKKISQKPVKKIMKEVEVEDDDTE